MSDTTEKYYLRSLDTTNGNFSIISSDINPLIKQMCRDYIEKINQFNVRKV